MLAKCGLTTDHIESLMKVLSGGENAKVRLCKIMNREANVLVLDEPTNHLDVDAKESLQSALKTNGSFSTLPPYAFCIPIKVLSRVVFPKPLTPLIAIFLFLSKTRFIGLVNGVS